MKAAYRRLLIKLSGGQLAGERDFGINPTVIARTASQIREVHERLPAPETFETAMGTIEKGTCAGVRFEVQGIVDGRPMLVAAHVNRLRDDIGPDWDRLSPGKTSGYKIEVEGSPSFRCEIEPIGRMATITPRA